MYVPALEAATAKARIKKVFIPIDSGVKCYLEIKAKAFLYKD